MKNKLKILMQLCFFCCIIMSSVLISRPNTNFKKVYAQTETYSSISETDICNLSKYDSRDLNIVTDIKDQGSSSLCWAYAAISASETSILKSGLYSNTNSTKLSLSPTSIGYGRFNRPADPLNNVVGASGGNWLNTAGASNYAGILMSQWWGPTANSTPASSNAYENTLYKFTNLINIYDDTFYNSEIRITEMKKAIAKYGAITFSYNNLRETAFYNPKNETSGTYSIHACTIIGWDDTITASNFIPNGAKQNGGWLVKNSYSSLPYFYLSYDCTSSNIFAFDFAQNDEYDYNYFYDDSLEGGMTEDLKTQYVANIFKAKKETDTQYEFLKAVNVAFACPNTSVTIDIYTDLQNSSDPESGTKQTTKTQTFTHSGYRTIELDKLVKIKKDSLFSIVVKLSSSSSSPYVSLTIGNNLSYRKVNGNYWAKINNNVLRIKGYTILEDKQVDTTVDIKNANLTPITEQTYTGNEIKPKITISYNNTNLEENVDYTIYYSNNINASKFAKITIVGAGNFVGEREEYFTINKATKPNTEILETINNQTANSKYLKDISPPTNYEWENPNLELTEGSNDVNIIYIGQDKDNFETTNFSIKINYVSKESEIEDDINKPTDDNDKPSDNNSKNDLSSDNLTTDNSSKNTKIIITIIISIGTISCITIGAIFIIKKFK